MPRTDRPGETLADASPLGTLVRAVLVIALTLTLVGVLRWAVHITNANARQVSTNLARLQDHFEREAGTLPRTSAASSTRQKPRDTARDPVIEPRR